MYSRSILSLSLLVLVACALWNGCAAQCPTLCAPEPSARNRCGRAGCDIEPCVGPGNVARFTCVSPAPPPPPPTAPPTAPPTSPPTTVDTELTPAGTVRVECPALGFVDFIGDFEPLFMPECFVPCFTGVSSTLDEACASGSLSLFETSLDMLGVDCCVGMCGGVYFSDDLGRCCADPFEVASADGAAPSGDRSA